MDDGHQTPSDGKNSIELLALVVKNIKCASLGYDKECCKAWLDFIKCGLTMAEW